MGGIRKQLAVPGKVTPVYIDADESISGSLNSLLRKERSRLRHQLLARRGIARQHSQLGHIVYMYVLTLNR